MKFFPGGFPKHNQGGGADVPFQSGDPVPSQASEPVPIDLYRSQLGEAMAKLGKSVLQLEVGNNTFAGGRFNKYDLGACQGMTFFLKNEDGTVHRLTVHIADDPVGKSRLLTVTDNNIGASYRLVLPPEDDAVVANDSVSFSGEFGTDSSEEAINKLGLSWVETLQNIIPTREVAMPTDESKAKKVA